MGRSASPCSEWTWNSEHEWALSYVSPWPGMCSHGELEENRDKEWIEKGIPAHLALTKIVLDKRFLKNIHYYLNFRSTSNLEIFNNHILMYIHPRGYHIHHQYTEQETSWQLLTTIWVWIFPQILERMVQQDIIGLILRRLVDSSPEKNQEDLPVHVQPCFRDNEEDSPKSLGVSGRNAPDSWTFRKRPSSYF